MKRSKVTAKARLRSGGAAREVPAGRAREGPFANNYEGLYYDPKNPANLLHLKIKQQFLRSAALHVPRFGNALFEAVFPLIVSQQRDHGTLPGKAAPEYQEFWQKINDSIRTWGREFGLDAEWIFDEAWGIVLCAINYKQAGVPLIEAFGTWGRQFKPGPDLRGFMLPAWDPHVESAEAYGSRLDIAWEKARRDYIKTKIQELKAAGLKKVPVARDRRYPEEKRYEWAVLHQCAKIPIEKLADQSREDTETIRTSVTRILRQLGLKTNLRRRSR